MHVVALDGSYKMRRVAWIYLCWRLHNDANKFSKESMLPGELIAGGHE